MSLLTQQVEAMIGAWSTAQNTTRVSKNWNDSTGLVNRFDKPFLTKQAWIDSTFTAGWGTVITFPWTYDEQQTRKTGVNMEDMVWVVNTYSTAFGNIITDWWVAVDCKLGGFWVWDLNAGDNSISLNTAGNKIDMKVSEIILNPAANWVMNYTGTLNIECDRMTNTVWLFWFFLNWVNSTVNIKGDFSWRDFDLTDATQVANIYWRIRNLQSFVGTHNVRWDATNVWAPWTAIVNYFGKTTTEFDQWMTVQNYNIFRVLTTWINQTVVADHPLYTVPVGRTAHVMRCFVHCTAAAWASPWNAWVGTNVTADNIYNGQTLSWLNLAWEEFDFPTGGTAVVATAWQTITFGINSASTGSKTINVHLVLFLT